MTLHLPANSSSVILPIRLIDSAGDAATAVEHDAAGLSAAYRHLDAATWTTITLVSGTLGTYASGSWAEDTDGEDGDYELGLPAGGINVQSGVRVRVIYDGVTRTTTIYFTGAAVDATGQVPSSNMRGTDSAYTGTPPTTDQIATRLLTDPDTKIDTTAATIYAANRFAGDTNAIDFPWPTDGSTITATRSINGATAEATTGTISQLPDRQGQYYYRLAYNAADRPGAAGEVIYVLTDGSNTRTLALRVDGLGVLVANIPTAVENAARVRVELATELAHIDTDISSVNSQATAANIAATASVSLGQNAQTGISNILSKIGTPANGTLANDIGEIDASGGGGGGGDATEAKQDSILAKLTGSTINVTNRVSGDGTIEIYRGSDASATIGTQLVVSKSGYASAAFASGAAGVFSYRQAGDTTDTESGAVAVTQSGDTVTATVTLTDVQTTAMNANRTGTYEIEITTSGGLKDVLSAAKLIVKDRVS